MSGFSSWRVGAPYYVPLLVLAIPVQFAALSFNVAWASTPFWAAFLFTLNFFRDPPRRINDDPEIIVSPSDGKIDAIEELDDCEYFDGPCTCVSIFLNVFNVHVNRVPDDATVTRIEYKEGEFRNAMDPDSRQINEANTLFLNTPHGPMVVRQISGAIARRIVCVTERGKQLTKGEKFGMIKFGSRTELYFPKGAEILVRNGQNVNGGSTDIARMTAL